jgi:hypothetical protein
LPSKKCSFVSAKIKKESCLFILPFRCPCIQSSSILCYYT